MIQKKKSNEQQLEDLLREITFVKKGKKVPRYDVQGGHLGGGAHSDVYSGYDQKEEREIAIKFAKTKSSEKKYEKEFLNISKIDHKNISKVFSIEICSNRAIIIMEKGDTSLDDEIETGRTKDVEYLNLVLPHLCDGLTYLHSMGIYHRDLKPANVLMWEDGTIKLTDFTDMGFEIKKTSDTPSGNIAVFEYKARECFIQKGIDVGKARANQKTPQAENYSLGVIAYKILTAETLFSGYDRRLPPDIQVKEILELKKERKYIESKLNYLKELGIEERIVNIIGKCLDPDSSKRYATAQELKDALLNKKTEEQIKKEKAYQGLNSTYEQLKTVLEQTPYDINLGVTSEENVNKILEGQKTLDVYIAREGLSDDKEALVRLRETRNLICERLEHDYDSMKRFADDSYQEYINEDAPDKLKKAMPPEILEKANTYLKIVRTWKQGPKGIKELGNVLGMFEEHDKSSKTGFSNLLSKLKSHVT